MELLQIEQSKPNGDQIVPCYKTFHLFDDVDNTITIKLSQEFNLVGLTTWEGISFLTLNTTSY